MTQKPGKNTQFLRLPAPPPSGQGTQLRGASTKTDLLLCMSKSNFPPTPCNPAPVPTVGLHNLASLRDGGETHPTVISLGPAIDKEIGLA